MECSITNMALSLRFRHSYTPLTIATSGSSQVLRRSSASVALSTSPRSQKTELRFPKSTSQVIDRMITCSFHCSPANRIAADLLDARQSGGQWNASAISTVNGEPAIDFFTQFAAENSQGYLEPHADWNNLMYSPAADIQGLVNAFDGSSPFYPGDVFSLVLENGTGVPDLQWLAVINDLSDVVSVANYSEFYSYFVVDDYSYYSSQSARRMKRDSVTTTTTALTSTATASESSAIPSQTSWSEPAFPMDPAYPQNPVISDFGDGGVISGYFLDSATGVLSIPNFSPDDVMAFSATVAAFLQKSKAAGMKKIVIDLQQNWGGLTLLATDTFKQVRSLRNCYSTTLISVTVLPKR